MRGIQKSHGGKCYGREGFPGHRGKTDAVKWPGSPKQQESLLDQGAIGLAGKDTKDPSGLGWLTPQSAPLSQGQHQSKRAWMTGNMSRCKGALGGSVVKKPPAVQETWIWFLDREDSLEKGMATHSSILAWAESHGQRSLAGYSPQSWVTRVGRDLATKPPPPIPGGSESTL